MSGHRVGDPYETTTPSYSATTESHKDVAAMLLGDPTSTLLVTTVPPPLHFSDADLNAKLLKALAPEPQMSQMS